MAETAREILLAWAESGGFAATHGAGASNEAIVDDLLVFLANNGWKLKRDASIANPEPDL